MDLLVGYLKAFPLEMSGELDGKEHVHNVGVVASVHVHTIGKGGQVFATLVRTY